MAKIGKARCVLALAALAILAAKPARADVIEWEGIFKFTVTHLETDGVSGIEGLAIGDSFKGSYSYLSPTVDGTFIASNSPGDSWDILQSFLVPVPGPFSSITGPFYAFLTGAIGQDFEPVIRVTGGRVSFFDWSVTFGPLISNFYGPQDPALFTSRNTWSYRLESDALYEASGTLHVGDPHRVPEPSTMLLLGAGLLALRGFRRKSRL
jgi:hypothetical protein